MDSFTLRTHLIRKVPPLIGPLATSVIATPLMAPGRPLFSVLAAVLRTDIMKDCNDLRCRWIQHDNDVRRAFDQRGWRALFSKPAQMPMADSDCPATFTSMKPDVGMHDDESQRFALDPPLLSSATGVVGEFVVTDNVQVRLL